MKAVLVTVAAVASVLVASAFAATPPFVECAVTSTSTTGGVTQIVSTKAWVTSRYVASAVSLKKADSICTNSTGSLWWTVSASGKTVKCNTLKSSSVRIFPPTYPGQAVRFRRGTSTCQVTGSGTMQFAVAGTTLAIKFNDPIVIVATDPKNGTTVKLVEGFAEITGESGGQSVVVAGPGQQTFVGLDGDPASPSVIRLAPAETAAVKRLQASSPRGSLARPAVGKSPVLRGIYNRGTIRVVLDAQLSPASADFAKAYFDHLAAAWKVKLELTTAPGADALASVAARRVDAAVTALDASAQLRVDAMPFVAEPDENDPDQLVVPDDAGYGDAMSGWMQQRLFFGKYGDLYRRAFGGAEAKYDPMRAVLP